MADSQWLSFRPAPIVTGTPVYGPEPVKKQESGNSESSFQSVLLDALRQNQGVSFSKHAVSRVMERNIDLSESSLNRLNEGVRLANQKGLDDTLILVDKNAFLVSVKNRTVVTAVGESELKGNIFTNIDGTVII